MAAVPGTALAYVDASDVAQLTARGGAAPLPSGTPPATGLVTAAQAQELAGIPTQTKRQQIMRELELLRGRTGTMPKMLPRIGTLGLAATAFQAGWLIGTGVNQKFLKIGLPTDDFVAAAPASPWTGTVKFKALERGVALPQWTWAVPAFVATEDMLLMYDSSAASPFDYRQFTVGTVAQPGPPGTCHTFPTISSLRRYSGPSVGWMLTPEGTCDRATGGYPTTADYGMFAYYQWVKSGALERSAPHTYNPGNDGIPDYAVSTWTGQPSTFAGLETAVSSELGLRASDYTALTQWLEDEAEAPTGTVEMPDCRGMTRAQCIDLLRAAGLHGTITTDTLDWDTAYTSRGAGVVVKTNPVPGKRLGEDGAIVITRNPQPDQMPTWVPEIEPGTRKDEVEKAITELDLDVEWQVADPAVPEFGPDEATDTPTVPTGKSKVPRGSTVTVTVNPPDADEPVGGGPTTGEVDFRPLKRIPGDFCDSFPFGAPCWLVEVADGWSAVGEAPSWTFTLPNPLPGGEDNEIELDLAVIEPALEVVRPVLGFIAIVSIVLWWAGLAMRGGKNVHDSRGGDE